jgi:4-hydroxybenzoate polyprenyltransferase
MIKKFLTWASKNEIIIAGSAAAIAYTTELASGKISPNILLLSTTFLMMWGVYRINKIMDIREDSINTPHRVKHIYTNKHMWFPPIFAFLIALILALIANLWAFIVIIIAFIWIVGYSIKLPKILCRELKYEKIKEIPLVKNLYASVAWGMIALISTFILNNNITELTWAIFLIILSNIFINEVNYDIRDIKGDKKFGIQTIPVIFGVKKTKSVLLVLLFITALLPVLLIYLHILPIYMLTLSLIALYNYYSIRAFAWDNDINFLCDVIISGSPIIWPFLILFGELMLKV